MLHTRYIDRDNLYGSKMLFDLPTEDYRLENKNFIKEIEKKLKSKKPISIGERGMFLEVDLNYPKKLHKVHEDFPLAPERYKITYNELSPINKFLYKNAKK